MMEILARMAKIQMTDFAELWFVFLVLYICPFTFLLVLVFCLPLKDNTPGPQTSAHKAV